MTEVLISHITPTGFNHAPLCILPNVKCKVIDVETGKSLPANAKGEICLKSPSMMTGYLNNETATRATIDEDGWVHSGDIGYYDDSESFNIVDRIKELIKVKAMQVAPSELEEVLLQHPKVKEVGVTGVPHDRFGEAPRAYVVTSTPTKNEDTVERLFTYQMLHHHGRQYGDGGMGIKHHELASQYQGSQIRQERVRSHKKFYYLSRQPRALLVRSRF
ncbi:Luciferin 4-monooxygenase [Portunus trituberculatus]|uniref:Luciferin 4-monooxygenase n=1 Tax=Portunus trituberculatus TaxID=210409 RepID=A0A5B7GEN6_PORTR|nr:Luciferin 4-monooxygenase [Portunus trituberculatus]